MGNHSIQNLFLSRLKACPQKIAICCDEDQYSFENLADLSRALAYKLWQAGVQPSDRVAILAERGPEVVWSILAVLRLGALFVVLDSSYPGVRLETLIDICAPRLILRAGKPSLSTTLDRLGSHASVPVLSADAYPIDDFRVSPEFDAVLDQVQPDAPAYYIFTSGSTGQPKGIACNHKPLTHFIEWHCETFALTSTDRFTMISGLSHDPILRDIFTPLSLGATLVIPRQSTITEPGALRSWFARHKITVTHLTPAMGKLLIAGRGQGPTLPHLRRLFWGGDKLSAETINDVKRLAPTSLHTNFYGCSETPQAAAFYRCDDPPSTTAIPIGQGTDGFTLEILDRSRQPVAAGEVGEIRVKSEFLSLGYVDRGRIIPPDNSAMSYDTGDRGYALTDGSIVLLGRSDDQIKIRGFRVDLAEVTGAMLQHARVLDAIALPIGSAANPKVGAFIAADPFDAGIVKDVSALLAERLPAYMLPEQIIVLDGKLPLLPNGKVDRRALQMRAEERSSAAVGPAGSESSGPGRTGPEDNLIAGWRPIFEDKQISSKSSFMSLGGDSLSYVEAYLVLEHVLGVVPSEWPEMSIERLAAFSKPKSRFNSSIDSFMAVRAFSIVSIVSLHFSLTSIGDGFTGALYVISGYLFGKVTLREVFTRGKPSGILTSIKNIIVPVVFFSVLFLLLDLFAGKQPFISEIMLSSDLTGYDKLAAQGIPFFRHHVLFWYVDCLIKILLILYSCIRVMPRKYLTPDYLKTFCIVVVVISCLVKFVMPGIMQPDFVTGGAPDLSMIQLSPVGNLAIFMMGATLANVVGRGRSLLAVAWILFALADARFYGLIHGMSIAGAGAMLLFFGRISVPRPVAAIIFTVSGASLFIYLTHLLFGYGFQTLFGEGWPALQVVIAVLGGIAVHSIWTWSSRHIKVWLHPALRLTRAGLRTNLHLQSASDG